MMFLRTRSGYLRADIKDASSSISSFSSLAILCSGAVRLSQEGRISSEILNRCALRGSPSTPNYCRALHCSKLCAWLLINAGPCRKFTPILSVTYEDRADKDEVEVIFVSSDTDADGFNEYYEEMPWCVLSCEFCEESGAAGGCKCVSLSIVVGSFSPCLTFSFPPPYLSLHHPLYLLQVRPSVRGPRSGGGAG